MSRDFDERRKTFGIPNVRPTCLDDGHDNAFIVEQRGGPAFIILRANGCDYRMTVEDARAMARTLADATQHAVLWSEGK